MSKDKKYIVRVNKKPYDVILHLETEDGGYWVECPTLPGCSSQGDTVEETLEMIKNAIKGHLAVQGEKKKKKTAASLTEQEQHLVRDSPVLCEVSGVLSGKQDSRKLRAEYQRRLAEKFR